MKSGQVLRLLALLAPIVMAVLGRRRRQGGDVNEGGLADILGSAFQKSASASGTSGTGGLGEELSRSSTTGGSSRRSCSR